MKKKSFYFILPILLILAYVISQFWLDNQKKSQEMITEHFHVNEDNHGHKENVIQMTSEQIRDLGIQTQVARPGEISLSISARGKIILHPDRFVHVLPKIPGVAKSANKNIGDSVSEGEILATLESREMADIKANYLATNEKLALAFSQLEREKRLHEKKVSAEQDYLNARSVYEEAKINVLLAQQKLHAFGVNEEEILRLVNEKDPDLKLYTIRSPMEGIVISRHITKGEFIENTTTIYEIADFSTVWIEIGIYPKDLVKVRKGQMVDIFLPDGIKALAKIIYLSPIIQDETITAKAVAELNNPSENWRPGSFVKVEIAAEKLKVPIVLPKDAIQEMDGKNVVFVRVSEGFEKRQVQLGVGNDTDVGVVSGINAGEEYASSKTFLLKADLSKEEAEHEH